MRVCTKYPHMSHNNIQVSKQMRVLLSKHSKLDPDTAEISEHVLAVQKYKQHENRCYFRVAHMRVSPLCTHMPADLAGVKK